MCTLLGIFTDFFENQSINIYILYILFHGILLQCFQLLLNRFRLSTLPMDKRAELLLGFELATLRFLA